jgi:hypothetical protein
MWQRRRPKRSSRRSSSPVRTLFYWTVFVLLPGCQPNGPDTPFEVYLHRLSTALAIEHVPHQAARLPALPAAEYLRLLISPAEVGPVEILDLGDCAVQSTFIKRNSALGRGAKPSQQLLLQLEYLRLAPPCIRHLQSQHKTALASTLEYSWQRGRRQLPALIFNATLGSEEYRAFWRATPTPRAYPRVDPGVALSALGAIDSQVRRWLAGDYRTQDRDFELALSEVAGGGGGELLLALSRQAGWLASADRMLQQWVAHAPSCSGPLKGSAANVLPGNTLPANARWYLEEELRPRITETANHLGALLSGITRLETTLSPVLLPRYRNWSSDRNRHFARLARAPLRHRELLERVEQICSAH